MSDNQERGLNSDQAAAVERGRHLLLAALRSGGKSFLSVFFIRAGLGFLGHTVGLARVGDWRALLSLEKLVGEKHLTARVESVRWALAVAVFAFSYRLTRDFGLRYVKLDALRGIFPSLFSASLSGEESQFRREALATSVAGFVAALAGGAVHSRETRRWLALLSFARACQAVYNEAKLRNFKGWFRRRKQKSAETETGSDSGAELESLTPTTTALSDADEWEETGLFGGHGDTLLFMLTSAQVMYSYALAPNTLPPSYYRFIVHTGPLDEVQLYAVRQAYASQELDFARVSEYYLSRGGAQVHGELLPQLTAAAGAATAASALSPSLIPCSLLHPHSPYCTGASIDTFIGAARRVVPVYFSVFALGTLFSWRRLLASPGSSLYSVIFNTLRSSAFMGAFNMMCMGQLCQSRRYLGRESALSIFFLAFVASSSVLLEKRSRRAELALYVLPRALDSFWLGLRDRGMLPSKRPVPGGPSLVLALATAICMTAHELRRGHMSNFVHSALDIALEQVPPLKEKKKKVVKK